MIKDTKNNDKETKNENSNILDDNNENNTVDDNNENNNHTRSNMNDNNLNGNNVNMKRPRPMISKKLSEILIEKNENNIEFPLRSKSTILNQNSLLYQKSFMSEADINLAILAAANEARDKSSLSSLRNSSNFIHFSDNNIAEYEKKKAKGKGKALTVTIKSILDPDDYKDSNEENEIMINTNNILNAADLETINKDCDYSHTNYNNNNNECINGSGIDSTSTSSSDSSDSSSSSSSSSSSNDCEESSSTNENYNNSSKNNDNSNYESNNNNNNNNNQEDNENK